MLFCSLGYIFIDTTLSVLPKEELCFTILFTNKIKNWEGVVGNLVFTCLIKHQPLSALHTIRFIWLVKFDEQDEGD